MMMKFSILDSRFSNAVPRRRRAEVLPVPAEGAISFNPKSKIQNPKSHQAFSLVEVLAAIAIIGIITFLAIPNLVRIKEDGERSLAISRAETLNMAMASYLQANGETAASVTWSGASGSEARYNLVSPYIAFAQPTLATYMPGGYSATFPTSLIPLTKATLTGPGGAISY